LDILLFGLLLGFTLSVVALDFYKETIYLGVFGGVLLILLGIFLAGGGNVTATYCDNFYNATQEDVCDYCCTTQTIGGATSDGFTIEGIGALLMFLGAGQALYAVFTYRDEKNKQLYGSA